MQRTKLVTSADLTRQEVDFLMEEAEKLRGKTTQDLSGKICATLFLEPSTRTRLSFESAILRLGGKLINITDATQSSVKKGETLEDTIRVMEQYADLIVMRHPQAGAAERAAAVIQKPFINAGDGPNQHPTQALLDTYTIRREVGGVDGKIITFVGDLKYGRTVHSLLYLLALYKPEKIHFVSPPALRIPPLYTSILQKSGIPFQETQDLLPCLPETDILYMTRIQEERFEDPKEYRRLKGCYILTPALVEQGKNSMKILHPLPRIDEIEHGVDGMVQAAYFRQVENGVYMRMALLKELVKNSSV